MENPVDLVTITIEATFNSGKKSKEQIEALIRNKIGELKEVTLKNCNINDENIVKIIISIPELVFEDQGPSNTDEIKEFILIFAPVFLIKERMPVKIRSVEVKAG